MATSKVQNKVAAVLNHIAEAATQSEDLATELLSVLKRSRVNTLERYEEVIDEAYALNGWQRGGGRPKEGEEVNPVPDAVKTYVSQIRRAYKEKLKVTSYKSMYDLRQAVKERATKARKKAERSLQAKFPALTGITVKQPDRFNGSLFHDFTVLWMGLPDKDQEAFENDVRALMRKWAKDAGITMRPGEPTVPVTLQ